MPAISRWLIKTKNPHEQVVRPQKAGSVALCFSGGIFILFPIPMPRTLEDIFYEVIQSIKYPLHQRVRDAFTEEEDRILRHKGVLEEVRRLESKRLK